MKAKIFENLGGCDNDSRAKRLAEMCVNVFVCVSVIVA